MSSEPVSDLAAVVVAMVVMVVYTAGILTGLALGKVLLGPRMLDTIDGAPARIEWEDQQWVPVEQESRE